MIRASTSCSNAVIVDHVEPQPGVRVGQDLPQHRATLPGDHRCPTGAGAAGQVQLALPRVQPPAGLAISTASSASACADPRCSSTSSRPPRRSAIWTSVAPDAVRHLPHEHHEHRPYRARLVCQQPDRHAADQHKHQPQPRITPSGTSQV